MEKKYTVMVINATFEEENLIIIKSTGSQYIKRYDEIITPEEMQSVLKQERISVDDCKIVVVGKDWEGKPNIEAY